MRDIVPRVTVAICTQSRPKLLAATLHCVLRQQYPADHYEVLVVDNAPRDESTAQVVRELQSEFSSLRYLAVLTAGLSHARNAAVHFSQAELIVFVDDDIVCEPGWLAHLVAPFAGDPDQRIAAVGGEVIPVYSEGVHRGGVQIYRPLRLRSEPGPIQNRQMLMGANMAFRRACLLDVDLFDARVGRKGARQLAGDENRPIERLRRCGLEIWFVPAARVFHELPRARTSVRYAVQHGYDSARSRVLTQIGALEEQRRSAAPYLISRLVVSAIKLPVLAFQAGLLALFLQRNALAPVVVRIARTLGYVNEIKRQLFSKPVISNRKASQRTASETAERPAAASSMARASAL